LNSEKIRVLSLIEGRVVSSPAQIVLRFARDCRDILDLQIVTFARGEDTATPTPLLQAAADLGIPAHVVRESGRYDFGAVSQLKDVCRTFKPDLVQTNSVKSHFLTSLLRNRQFGWLAFHHGYTDEDFKMRLYNQLDRFSLRACDRVVTVCQAFATQLEGMAVPLEKITVVPNGIPANYLTLDVNVAQECRRKFEIADGESVVLSLGRLSPEKGHQHLIASAARLRAANPYLKFKILIAGAGILEASLREQVESLGLRDTVKLLSHQPDVKPLWMIADIFVLPSLSEGSPMVLLESMAAQVPVVATAVGGIPEAVTDKENALLVPPADAQRLADAMNELLTQPERRNELAAAAFEHVRKAFSPELYNERVLAAFHSVLDQKRDLLAQRVRAS